MRILVTGADGFLGRHLTTSLSVAGHHVAGFDLRVGWDVNDVDAVDHAVRESEAVYHLACVVGYANVMAGIEQSVYTTTVGTANVVRACIRHCVPLIFTSTSAVYGHGQRTENGGAKEDDHLKLGPTTTPSWAYAYAKAAAECQVLAAHRERGLQATVVRLFNVVGPGQSAQAGFVFPRFIGAALRGEPLRVYLPGTQTRTFAHVADVVGGLVRCLGGAAIGEVVNLGGHVTLTMEELAQTVIQTTGSTSTWTLVPAPYVGYEEIRERRPDLSKAKRLLGYQPTRSLAAMIEDTAAHLAPEVLV